MNRNLISLMISSIILITFNASAEDKPKATYDDLTTLQSKNYLLTEALKNAKLQKELSDLQNPTAASPNGSVGLLPQTPSNIGMYSDQPAQVEMISGVGGRLTAKLQLQGGGSTIARVGTNVPNVGVVKSIKVDEVLVQRGKQIVSVPFVYVPLNNSTSVMPQPQTNQIVPSFNQGAF